MRYKINMLFLFFNLYITLISYKIKNLFLFTLHMYVYLCMQYIYYAVYIYVQYIQYVQYCTVQYVQCIHVFTTYLFNIVSVK